MKRLLALACIVALGAVTAAVALAGSSPPTKKADTLIVGIDTDAVGFSGGRSSGTRVITAKGFEVDLARTLARRLGLTVEFYRQAWAGMFSPGPKKFDIAFEQVTIKASRAKVIDFSVPYFDANQGVLIRKGITAPTSLADLKKLQTCGQVATTGLDYIQKKLRPQRAPRVYQTLAAAFQAVAVGRCDAIVMDVPIVASERKDKPGRYGPLAGQIVTKERYGAVFQKGSGLRSFANKELRALKANGTIKRLQKKWFSPYPDIRVLR